MITRSAVEIGKAFLFSVEGPIILAILIAGTFWSNSPSGRSFWGDMACHGNLFPKWIEQKDPAVRPGLATASEQREAYQRAAQHVGFDERESKATGLSAATACRENDV